MSKASKAAIRILILVGVILALMLAGGAPSDFPNGRTPVSSAVLA
jgi:hypothetical protein